MPSATDIYRSKHETTLARRKCILRILRILLNTLNTLICNQYSTRLASTPAGICQCQCQM